MVVDGVDTDIDIRQVDMVIIETLNAGLEILVILQGTIHPVDTGYGIGLLLQINHRLLSGKRTHMGSDTHRVTRHVERDV